ncbi:MAG: TetR/AcrR family transcriptional regulator [Sphingorhabdus sp.]
MQAADVQNPAKSRGRPRDPQIEARVFDAAAKIYGDHGWSGYGFDAVARLAGVGKSSLYARWASAAALLRDAIAFRWRGLMDIDNGNFADDMTAFATLVLTNVQQSGGRIPMHLRRDIATQPEVRDTIGPILVEVQLGCVALVERAERRGELRNHVSAEMIAEVLTSALEHYAARNASEAEHQKRVATTLDREASAYVTRLVDLILDGARN